MAKIFGLDIPLGLEDAFKKALQLKPKNDDLNLAVTLPKQNHARRKKTANRSYIPIFAPIFDAYTLTRRNAWHAYWGGWPGSGFSAFLQVNAPRYKVGQPLLDDPPVVINLVPNGDFNGDATGWGLLNFLYVLNDIEPIDNTQPSEATSAHFDLLNGHTYRVYADVGTGTSDVEIAIATNGSGGVEVHDFGSTTAETLSFDFVQTEPDTSNSYFDIAFLTGSKSFVKNCRVIDIT